MRARWCRVGAALFVASCVSAVDDDLEVSGQAQPLVIADDAQPAREVSANADDPPPHGVHHLALPGGRILRGGRLLHEIDLRDPARPRVADVFDSHEVGLIYPLGGHALVPGSKGVYRGERDDIPIPREPTGALLNIDYSVRGKLRVVNSVDVGGPFALGQGQVGGAIYGLKRRAQGQEVYLRRYELRGERLVLTGELQLEGPVKKLEPFGSRLAIEFQTEIPAARIAVVDGSGPDLQLLYQTSASTYYEITALAIDGPKLRVAFAGGEPGPALDTFDLTKDASQGTLARCDIEQLPYSWNSPWLNATFYSKADHTFFVSDDGQNVTHQVPFNASGQCPLKRVLHDSSSKAFHAPAAQRLLAVDSSDLSMLTTRQTASQPLIARERLAGIWSWSDSARPIRVFELDRAVFAPNGTREPWLVGMSYYAEFDGPVEGTFEVFTASRDTLTPRSAVHEYQYNGDIELYGRTLVTMSAASLRTFDLRNLEVPKPLGRLDLVVSFHSAFRFGDHVLRTRSIQLSGPSEGFDSREDMVLERLDTLGASPVATWPVRWNHVFIRAEDLLLDARWIHTQSERSPYLNIQVYDLSQPSQPRNAGAFFSDEIRPGGGNDVLGLAYQTVGRALLIAQRTEPDGPRSSLQLIDFSDPDYPSVGARRVTFPSRDFSNLRTAVRAGTTLYHSEQKPNGWYATRIVVDGSSMDLSDEVPIPAAIVAATEHVAFTASSDAMQLSLSRVDFGETQPTVSASRAWPGRQLLSIRGSDDGQYLYITHCPHYQVPPGNEPRSHWSRLEVLDAQTLDPVGMLDLDASEYAPPGRIEESAKGRLFIQIEGALLFVDVRDPAHPTARAAVPYDLDWGVTSFGNKVYVNSRDVRSYPIDLRNLTN